MRLGSATRLAWLLLILVSAVVSVGLWACETADPTPIEPTRLPSATAAPVVRVEPTSTVVPTRAPVPTLLPTAAPVPTEIPSPTETPTATQTVEPTPTRTLVPTDTPEPTPTPTASPTHAPAPTSTSTPTQLPTDTPTPTAILSPEATAEPEPEATAESADTISVEATIVVTWIDEDVTVDGRVAVDEDTVWGELFEELDGYELTCIDSALDREDIEAMSVRPVSSIVRFTDRHDLAVWGCLSQEHSVDLYVSIFLLPELDSGGDELAEIEDCYRSLLPYADLRRYIELSVVSGYSHASAGNGDRWLLLLSLGKCVGSELRDLAETGHPPVFEIEPINFVPNAEVVWRETIDWASLSEQACIRDELGTDRYGTFVDEVVFDGGTEPWEVAVWGCLRRESAAALFKRAVPFRSLREGGRPIDNFRVHEEYRSVTEIVEGDDEVCLDRVLSRLDFPRFVSAGLPEVGDDDYRHGMAALIGVALCVGKRPEIVDVDDHGDFLETATEIEMGRLIEGTADGKFVGVADADVFKFSAEASVAYELYLRYGDEDQIGHHRYGPGAFNFKLFEEGEYHPIRTASPIFWEANTSGTVYLIAVGGGDLRYRIKVTVVDQDDDFGGDVDSAHEIMVGETIDGTITFAREVDVFSFTGERGVNYQIDASSSVPRLGVPAEPFRVYFVDDEGLHLRSVYNRVIWQAPYSGQHYIQVSGEVPASYSISVSIPDFVDDHGDDPESATFLEFGDTTRGVIDHDDDVDVFLIDLARSETIEIDIESSIHDDIYVDVWKDNRGLFGADGFPMIWEAASSGSHVIRVRTPRVIGDYLITVRPSDYVDDYPDDALTPIEFGVPIEVFAQDQHDFDAFTFAATRGQSYVVTVEPGTIGAFQIRIDDAGRNELESTPGYPAHRTMTWQAWEDGNYTVYVVTETPGSYTVRVSLSEYRDDHADDRRFATPLTLGEPVSGLVDIDAGFFWIWNSRTFGDQDLFSFEAEVGKRYSIEVELGSLLRSDIQLYDAGGEFLDSADTRLVWEAASPGRHYVRISGFVVGDYTITVMRID